MPNTVTSGTATPVPHPAREFELGGIKMQLGSRGSGAFELAAEFDYRVQGDLVLGGSNPASPATLTFVDHDPDPDFPEEGSLGASGSLTLGTNLVNCGKLVANVDVVLSPQDVAMNKREEGNDVAIFAGRDVTIAPFFGGSAAFRTADNRAFVFRGVIYAERNFQFLSDALYNSTLEYERNLFIEGAVVARRGEVHIQGNEKAQLKYNREYLDDLLEKTVESDQVQVEEMSWRPR